MFVTSRQCLGIREVLASQINIGFSEVSTLLKHLIIIQNTQNERLIELKTEFKGFKEQSDKNHKELLDAIKGIKS